jgi:hypothetical protein
MSHAADSRINGDRREYGCNGKEDYGSWSNAEKVAKRSRMKGRAAGTILAPYRCKFCGGHHLTSVDTIRQESDKRNRRRRKEERTDYDEE